jgi:septal ring factor EnvC (AmiA/AmiB activator)
MTDQSTLGPETIAAASATAGTALGAIVKTLIDWRKDRNEDRLKANTQRITSEDQIRDDLMSQIRDQRKEITDMRGELAAARIELRESIERHQRDIERYQTQHSEMLGKYEQLYAEVVQLRRGLGRLATE